MKNNPVYLCIAATLLTSSGGLNVGLSGFVSNPLAVMTTALGIFFIIAGSVGMGLSFYFLYSTISRNQPG